MRQKRYAAAAVCLLAAGLLGSNPAAARRAGGGDLFETIGGTWSGGGTAQTPGGAERLRCRASYSPGGASLSLSIRCASDSFKLDIASNLQREGNRVSGQFRESSFGVSGAVSGAISGSAINGVVEGGGVTGQLYISVHGDSQTLSISSPAGSANVVLRRE